MPHRYATRRTLVRGRAVAGGGGVGVAPTLDGAAGTGTGVGTAVSLAVPFATSQTNDILVAFVFHNRVSAAGSATTVLNVTDNNSLPTWTRRPGGSQVNGQLGGTIPGTPWCALDVFWTFAAAIQTATTVTANFAAATDNCALILRAVHGCGNTAAPWDVNGSLPAVNKELTDVTTAPTATAAQVSTTAPGTLMMMFAMEANTGGAPADQTTGTGFTVVTNQPSSGGTNFSKGAVQTGPFTTAQSGLTPAFAVGWRGWIEVVDALVGT